MYSGDIETALPPSRRRSRRSPAPARSRSSSAGTTRSRSRTPRASRNVLGHGRVSMIHFDAHADTGDIEFGSLWGHGQPMRRLIESGAAARRPLPADRPARLLAAAGDAGLDGRAADAVVRDDRDRAPRPGRVPHRGVRASPRTTATACSCRSTSTSATRVTRPARAPRSRAASPRVSCSTPFGGSVSSCPSSASTSWRSVRRTTTPTSPRRWPTASCSRRCPQSPAVDVMPETAPRWDPAQPLLDDR